nr:uncharacterized protein LOC106831734 [Equus asinus]
MYSYIFRAARVNICRNKQAASCSFEQGPRSEEAGGGGPTKGRLEAGAVSPPGRAPGAAGEGCFFDLGAGWKPRSCCLFSYLPRSPGQGCLGWLLLLWLLLETVVETLGRTVKPIVNALISLFFRDTSPNERPWAISRRRHLDSPNLWCGRYRCSLGLTSLSEGEDHTWASTTETSPSLAPPPQGSSFSQSTSACDSRKTSFRLAKAQLKFHRLQEAFPATGASRGVGRLPLGNRTSSPRPREKQGRLPPDGSRLQWVSVSRRWIRAWETQPQPGLPVSPLSTS